MRRALILAGCLAVTACGGGGAAAAPHSAPAQPAPAQPAPAQHSAGGSAMADRCAGKAGGDPSSMMICLSEHHAQLPDGFNFRACVKGVHDGAGAVECMRKLAR